MRLTLDHVSFRVRNLEVSAKFYTEVLGLEEIENGTGVSGIRWFAISGKEAIHMTEGDPAETRVTKRNHFAVRTDSLAAAIEHLTARGIRYFDWAGETGKILQRIDGVRQIYVEDPDGYWVEINDHR